MPINVLVIDDDKRIVERLMKNLKRMDSNKILGEIYVDDTITELENIAKYDVSDFKNKIDVALIDYQLSCSFTGILVSAWIALDLGIPRLTLTTAAYPGNPEYFNGSILKQEITDSPGIVIERIKECVECYNSELWLNKQHHALVIEYQNLLKEGDRTSEFDLNAIQNILDKFERILDDRQERELQKILSYENIKDDFSKKEQENEKKLSDLNKKLEKCLEALGKSE